MKTCTKCQQSLSLDNFPPDNRARDGKQARCSSCINTWIKNYYHTNPVVHMLQRAKARSRHKGFECTITQKDITPLPKTCSIFGMELTRGNGQQCISAFSLDRIDNSKGYIPGNVTVMSYLANRLKNDGTAAQHRRIADWMEEHGQ